MKLVFAEFEYRFLSIIPAFPVYGCIFYNLREVELQLKVLQGHGRSLCLRTSARSRTRAGVFVRSYKVPQYRDSNTVRTRSFAAQPRETYRCRTNPHRLVLFTS